MVSLLPLVPKQIVWKIARNYIAGETLEDAVGIAKKLNSQGAYITMDVLGESVAKVEESTRALESGKLVIDTITDANINSNYSVKLTQLGLKIDKGLCLENVRKLVKKAAEKNNFIRIDMEDSSCTQDTLDIYYKLRSEGFLNVGPCIQAYLKRSESDVRELTKSKTNIRVCKGIYVEPENIAFKDREQIKDNYLRLIHLILENNSYPCIATHDESLAENTNQIVKKYDLHKGEYEFQMLLGVQPKLREKLIREGHKLRVYVPFGKEWYAYSMRRFKENPQIAGYIAKKLFGLEKNNSIKK
jgi:proline dehydrogenase